jgi:hypothetical protein
VAEITDIPSQSVHPFFFTSTHLLTFPYLLFTLVASHSPFLSFLYLSTHPFLTIKHQAELKLPEMPEHKMSVVGNILR